ncbi:MAG: DinB family protein [Candidatus Thorarchaeota archaeon]
MDETKKRVVSLEKTSGLSDRVALWYSMMERVRERLLKRVEGLSNKELDYTPHEESVETIGTLLLHIAAVEWSWIFEDMGRQEMDYEKWKHAFALREGIPQLKGKKLRYYLDRLNSVREDVLNRLIDVSDSELDHLVDIGEAAVSIEWILFHLIEHEAMHVGQISVLRRLQEQSK